eukprot:8669697-Lingulodinium_polyedra.AAC.1
MFRPRIRPVAGSSVGRKGSRQFQINMALSVSSACTDQSCPRCPADCDRRGRGLVGSFAAGDGADA